MSKKLYEKHRKTQAHKDQEKKSRETKVEDGKKMIEVMKQNRVIEKDKRQAKGVERGD